MANKPSPIASRFLADWPAIARGVGVAIIVVEAIGSLVGLPVSSSVLAAAGGLLVVPNVAGIQDRRNKERGEDES